MTNQATDSWCPLVRATLPQLYALYSNAEKLSELEKIRLNEQEFDALKELLTNFLRLCPEGEKAEHQRLVGLLVEDPSLLLRQDAAIARVVKKVLGLGARVHCPYLKKEYVGESSGEAGPGGNDGGGERGADGKPGTSATTSRWGVFCLLQCRYMYEQKLPQTSRTRSR